METAQGRRGAARSTGLRIRLLGGFALELDGEPLAGFEAPRLQSLLTYLLINRGRDLARDRVAFAFWPDSEEGQARTNLRQALHNMRRSLPDAERFLDAGSRSVRWRDDAPAAIDVDEFEAELSAAAEARAGDDAASKRDHLTRAIELYAGDLVPESYDDWIAEERERLRTAHLAAAERLADLLEEAREYREAIAFARRVYDDNPLNESATRRLIRLHALAGDRAAALRVYHGFATALARETGVEPSAETRQAYERLLEPDSDASFAAEGPALIASPAAAGPSEFVGRRREWSTLQIAWDAAAAGHACLALITGEPGIGKSRLCDELREWASRQGITVASGRCYPLAGGLAYAPVIELLRAPAIAPRLRRLGAPWLSELARLLPELLEEHPELAAPAPLTDDWQRTRLFDAVSRALVDDETPLLLTIDDLQWCDRETLGWIQYVLGSRPQARLMVLATGRPEVLDDEHPARTLRTAVAASGQGVDIPLAALDAAETAELAAGVSGRAVDAEVRDSLHRETEGNPLFVIEWVRAGLDEGAHAAEPDVPVDPATPRMPPRMLSVIEGRISQLSVDAQELAALASTVGRDFTFDLLSAASTQDEEQLVEALDELWSRRIVVERGSDAYDFGHDRIREAAYARVGSAHRLLLHRRVAQAIELANAADLDPVAGELARHYEAAGWPRRAIAFYLRGAEVARNVYANDAAIELYSSALRLLGAEPEAKERDQRELEILTALGPPMVARAGYAADQVRDVYARARELSETLGIRPGAPVLRGLALFQMARGKIAEAHEFGRQLTELGGDEDDAIARVEGEYVLGVTSFWLGELEAAVRHLQAAIDGYDPANAELHISHYSQDPRAVCESRLAYTLNFIGEPERAEQIMEGAIAYAEQLGHPFSRGYVYTFASWLAIDQQDEQLARERIARFATLASEQQLGFLQPMSLILRGWMLGRDGSHDEAIELIRQGIDEYGQSGWTLYQPYSLTLLIAACIDAGRHEQARDALGEARRLTERIGQRVYDAELDRLDTLISA